MIKYYYNNGFSDHIKVFNTSSGNMKLEKVPNTLNWRVFRFSTISGKFHYLGVILCVRSNEKFLYDTIRLEYPSYLAK